ncbi:hypothetical protein FB451DRAFT_1196089 [Mycena latifolia]|nr:hypothetical protein FB451DRAFT_1196089 [Mycena latifolia]
MSGPCWELGAARSWGIAAARKRRAAGEAEGLTGGALRGMVTLAPSLGRVFLDELDSEDENQRLPHRAADSTGIAARAPKIPTALAATRYSEHRRQIVGLSPASLVTEGLSVREYGRRHSSQLQRNTGVFCWSAGPRIPKSARTTEAFQKAAKGERVGGSAERKAPFYRYSASECRDSRTSQPMVYAALAPRSDTEHVHGTPTHGRRKEAAECCTRRVVSSRPPVQRRRVLNGRELLRRLHPSRRSPGPMQSLPSPNSPFRGALPCARQRVAILYGLAPLLKANTKSRQGFFVSIREEIGVPRTLSTSVRGKAGRAGGQRSARPLVTLANPPTLSAPCARCHPPLNHSDPGTRSERTIEVSDDDPFRRRHSRKEDALCRIRQFSLLRKNEALTSRNPTGVELRLEPVLVIGDAKRTGQYAKRKIHVDGGGLHGSLCSSRRQGTPPHEVAEYIYPCGTHVPPCPLIPCEMGLKLLKSVRRSFTPVLQPKGSKRQIDSAVD